MCFLKSALDTNKMEKQDIAFGAGLFCLKVHDQNIL